MSQDSCLYPENAPRTGYNKGCRCARCKTEKSTQKRAEYARNTQTYRQYQKTHPRPYTRAPKRQYSPRPGCTHPHLSPYTAWDRGCRCGDCKTVRAQHGKQMRNCVLAKAKEAMRTRARNANVPMPSTPQQVNELLRVYIKRRILAESGIACHVDHIIPLSDGGTHTADNVRILQEHENVKRHYFVDTVCHSLDLVTPEQWNTYNQIVKKLV